MTLNSIMLDGIFYDGEFPVKHQSLLTFNKNEASLSYEDVLKTYPIQSLNVSPRIGNAERFINFTDGGQYQCAHHPFLDQLPQEVKSEGPVAWLEKRLVVAIVSILVTVCSLLVGYFYGLPAATDSIVQKIPISTEASLGRKVLKWIDDSNWFQPSELDQEQQKVIAEKFSLLHEKLKMSPHIKLEFRNSKTIGPNAFALPGGTLVITDQLIELAQSNDEILAVLGHELGHVERRHSLRKILQSSVVALAVATVTGDATSLSTVVTGLPTILLQSQHSRELETEADDFAFDLLVSHNIPTKAFADLMERLEKKHKKSDRISFLSSHPVTSERLEKARAVGQNTLSQEQ